jgi:hypothetical protein
MARHLRSDGHETIRLGFKSTRLTYDEMLRDVADQLHRHGADRSAAECSFVCHSLGGLIWRDLPKVLPGFRCGRSVLLGSPIQGSAVARLVRGYLEDGRPLKGPFIKLLLAFGLGKKLTRVLPTLSHAPSPEPDYPGEFLTVAGSRLLKASPTGRLMLQIAAHERSDSTVLVVEAQSTKAYDNIVVAASHTALPRHRESIDLVRRYLLTGDVRGELPATRRRRAA